MEDEVVEKTLSSKHDDCDWLLQHLVEMANLGIHTYVTLTTGAGMVTGQVIGGEMFFDLYKEVCAGAWPESYKKPFFEVVDVWKTRYKRDDEDKKFDPPIYIHMKDVKVFNAGVFVPANEGVLWRGKLDSITGFSIGHLGPTEE